MARVLALPNVTPDAIAVEAHRLYGAQLELEAEALRFEQTKREVAERGVDPAILMTVLKEAKADPTERMLKERTIAQYAGVLRVPTVKYEVGYGDLLSEEPEPETDADRLARVEDEGFWAFITHQPMSACPNTSADDAKAWVAGYDRAQELIGLSL